MQNPPEPARRSAPSFIPLKQLKSKQGAATLSGFLKTKPLPLASPLRFAARQVNRTSRPRGLPSTSSSRITGTPRRIVATGHPVICMPANGVQPQGEVAGEIRTDR
jgi:hypothetical protein